MLFYRVSLPATEWREILSSGGKQQLAQYDSGKRQISQLLDIYNIYCCSIKCSRRMEKLSWTDRVRNEEVLHRVKEERNIVHTVKKRKANWIGHILRRNCLLKHVIEGKLEGMIQVSGRRRRRR
jgi:hypothetical protein